jgi:hypothetical protein
MRQILSDSWYKGLRPFLMNNQMAVCVGTALLGFIYALIVLLGTPSKSRFPAYGEIAIANKTDLLTNILRSRISELTLKQIEISNRNRLLRVSINGAGSPKQTQTADLAKLAIDSAKVSAILWTSRRDINLLNNHNADTSMTLLSNYLYVKKEALSNTLNSKDWADDNKLIKTVPVLVVDTCLWLVGSPKTCIDVLKLKQNKRGSVIEFIGDYPMFGFWVVLSIGQIMLWFILFPLLGGNLLSQKAKLGILYNLTLPQRLINFITAFGFLVIFCLCFYMVLTDRYIITDHYFLTGFNTRMIFFGIPGYLVAGFCFMSYLTLAQQFDAVNDDYLKSLNKAAPGAAPPTDKYLSLKGAFDNTFFCSALILTSFVICEAVLIYAINSTEASRFYRLESGRPLIPGDFVYLMGLLHTFVLLVFYIPVKIKFNTLPIMQPGMMALPGAPSPLQSFFSSIGTLLITVSPVIAGLSQNLLSWIFK